jgi:DNA-directed RNA polymerase specialized sigma24 family protein
MTEGELLEPKQFDILMKKLDHLIALLVGIAIRNIKIQNEQILLLSSAGFKPSEIAEILGTTSNTIRVALSTKKKKRSSKKTDKVKAESKKNADEAARISTEADSIVE